jgi:hypothetical protein
MKSILLPVACFLVLSTQAQLVIENNATFFIGQGAVVTVQGNLTTNVDIQAGGTGDQQGKIQLKGSGAQQINTNGFVIPRLEIDNTMNASLTGDVKVGNRLEFTNGKFQLGAFNFILEDATAIINAGNDKFLEANNTGEARRLVSGNVADRVIPVGFGSNYTPFIYTTTGGTYNPGAFVGVKATGAAIPTPQRHPRTESYLGTAWKVNRSGIPAGTLAGRGTYVDGLVTGTEGDIVGMFWNGATWALGTGQDASANFVSANIPVGASDLYGMNKFLLVNTKAILQGGYNSGTGLMAETYRTAPSVLPLTDPYRSAQLSSFFTHVANNTAESIDASVLADQGNGNHNIVDWIFVQLRTITNATTAPVVQTRSALLRRNGEIVDIDNVSPLYFKNLDGGNYSVSIRHRNHLGISSNPAVPIALGLTPTTFDFTTTAAGNVYGTAGTNYLFANSVRQMYAGDVNTSGVSNYVSFTATDRAALLTTMANPGNAPTPARSINNVSDYLNYGRGDLNFDKSVNYISFGVTDRSYLLATVLGGVLNASKTQLLPNN